MVSSLAISATPDCVPLFNGCDLGDWKVECREKDRDKVYWQVRDETHRRSQVGLRGHIALQLHAGDDLKIRFKDLRIRELPVLADPSPATVVRDEDQLRKALTGLQSGAVVRIAPGNYRPGLCLANVHGTPEQPIIIEGLGPRSPLRFEAGNEAWHLIPSLRIKKTNSADSLRCAHAWTKN